MKTSLWPGDMKIKRDHLHYHCSPSTKKLSSKRVIRYWVKTYWTKNSSLTLWLKNQEESSSSKEIYCIKISDSKAKRSNDIEQTNAKTSSLTLTFDELTWKLIGNIYSTGATTCIRFGLSQAKQSKNIEWKIFFKRTAVWPWPLTK